MLGRNQTHSVSAKLYARNPASPAHDSKELLFGCIREDAQLGHVSLGPRHPYSPFLVDPNYRLGGGECNCLHLLALARGALDDVVHAQNHLRRFCSGNQNLFYRRRNTVVSTGMRDGGELRVGGGGGQPPGEGVGELLIASTISLSSRKECRCLSTHNSTHIWSHRILAGRLQENRIAVKICRVKIGIGFRDQETPTPRDRHYGCQMGTQE